MAQLDAVQRAHESGDPRDVQTALQQVEVILGSLADPVERAGLILQSAVLLGCIGKYEEAKTKLKDALLEAPNDEVTIISYSHIYGCMLHQEGLYEQAYECLTGLVTKHSVRLKQLDTRFIYEDVQQRRGLELVQLLRFSEALPLLEFALLCEMNTEDRNCVMVNIGICCAKMERYEEAVEAFRKSLGGVVTSDWEGHAHCQLGIALAHLRRFREAKEELKICEDRSTEFDLPAQAVYGWLSRVCSALGEKSEAARYSRLSHPC